MDNRIEEARKIVKSTFENPFDKDRFRYFAKNLLNRIDESPFVYRGNTVPHNYGSHIKTLERIGKYIDPEGNKIDILIVQLKKEKSLERARAMQRDLIARYLNGSRGGELKEAALVAFVAPDQDDWRFSLVKMDYKLIETPAGNIKAKEEFTPARRWSFLVGKNEKSHTAQSRLVDIFVDDVNDPSLAKLENAFDIEKVTKEFFEKYRRLYIRLTESLTAIVKEDSKIKKDFDEKSVEVPNFTKKLLGQIVFLYFLQKKGWLGAQEKWGDGDKSFSRNLFEKCKKNNKNFFNDYLEHLFYDALNNEHRGGADPSIFRKFNCKIPFLNGGLFEPMNDYDWVHTDINLPNELFSNDNLTREGDIGDGILDIFDRYNFTVKEDEPLEKEVAVDPEMLGKVFENLLEVKDRKSKGTYYTPREIVHYMCHESLVNYLKTETKIDEERIRKLVTRDIFLTKEDVDKWKKEKKSPSNKVLVFWEGEYQELDEALKKIRIVDPACGSGAFLVGMLQEIVKARKILQLFGLKNQNEYSLKEEAIQNCIYGVDIDPGAVEIAKLRLWLSLIVEEEDIRQIRPLPNLDYKIMQGNSLLEEFEGVKLFDEKLLKEQVKSSDDTERLKKLIGEEKEIAGKLLKYYEQNPKLLKNKKIERPIEVFQLENELKKIQFQMKRETEMTRLDAGKEMNGRLRFGDYSGRSEVIGEELKKLHDKFFKSSSGSEKNELKKEIEQLEWLLIEETLKEQNKKSALRKLEKYKKDKIKPFFLWKLNFGEVFQEKGGFDVVIANPPYFPIINLQKNIKEMLLKDNYDIAGSFAGKIDIYAFFILKSLKKIIKRGGCLSYIIPKTILSNISFSGLREHIIKTYTMEAVVDLEKVFSSVTGTMTYLLIFIKNQNPEKTYDLKINDMNLNGQIKSTTTSIENFKNIPFYIWVLSKEKLLILNKLSRDSAFLKDNYTTKNGVCTGDNQRLLSKNKKNDFYKKIIVAKDISKYHLKKAKHFVYYKTELLHRPREIEIFKGPKIVSQMIRGLNTSERLICTIDYSDNLVLNNVNIIRKKSEEKSIEFLLGLINSKLINYYFRSLITDVNIKTIYLDIIPIKTDNNSIGKNVENNVNKILAITRSDDYLENPEKQAEVKEYEKQIDRMVYKLYGLTEDEIKIIENSRK